MDGYLNSKPAVPYLALNNPSFCRRHQVSTVLAGFLEHALLRGDRPGAPRLKDFFSDSVTKERRLDLRAAFVSWLETDEGALSLLLAEGVAEWLPPEFSGCALAGEELRTHCAGVVFRFIDEIAERWQALDRAAAEQLQQVADPSLDEEGRLKSSNRHAARMREKKQFLDQFLVNLLSRMAVIPTYSFPVHTIRLEITETHRTADQSRFAQDDSLQLDRDAALAIGEYAPGAEVVAGGRIWTSRGIVRRPKEYMPDQYHRICEACGHPEIHLQREDFGQVCPQCAEPPKARVRKFIQPTAFMTAYSERQGRDPGTSRLRARPVDEARLLTRAPFRDYAATDIVSVSTFFAPAVPARGEPEGRLFVVNRGRKERGTSGVTAASTLSRYRRQQVWVGRPSSRTRTRAPATGVPSSSSVTRSTLGTSSKQTSARLPSWLPLHRFPKRETSVSASRRSTGSSGRWRRRCASLPPTCSRPIRGTSGRPRSCARTGRWSSFRTPLPAAPVMFSASSWSPGSLPGLCSKPPFASLIAFVPTAPPAARSALTSTPTRPIGTSSTGIRCSTGCGSSSR